jgi:hypothetical protein
LINVIFYFFDRGVRPAYISQNARLLQDMKIGVATNVLEKRSEYRRIVLCPRIYAGCKLSFEEFKYL